jgi:hypothetical protein
MKTLYVTLDHKKSNNYTVINVHNNRDKIYTLIFTGNETRNTDIYKMIVTGTHLHHLQSFGDILDVFLGLHTQCRYGGSS